jgi:hypothetical protein
MFTTPNLVNCLAIDAGRHRLALPTFTARRKTTQRIAINGVGAEFVQSDDA